MLRRIALEQDIELTVLYGSDFSVKGYQDDGFLVEVKWDLPLLDGYRHEFLPVLRDIGTQTVTSPLNYGIYSRLRGKDGLPGYDLLWVHGYAMVNSMTGMLAAKALGIPVLLRSDSSLKDRPRSGAKLAEKRLFFEALRWLVDGVLVAGTLNEQYWRYYFGDEKPLFRMPYAVDNDYFQRRALEVTAGRGELMAELGLEPGRGGDIVRFEVTISETLRPSAGGLPAAGDEVAAGARWCGSLSVDCGGWRGSGGAGGGGAGVGRDQVLRVSQPVGAAAVLRYRDGVCAAGAA